MPSSYQVVLLKQESFVVLRPLQIEFFRNLLECPGPIVLTPSCLLGVLQLRFRPCIRSQEAPNRDMGNPQKVSQHAGLSSLASTGRPKNHNNNGSWLLVHFGKLED